jgi:nitrite reductase/ring-hydroxylating ferredoxin subunit/uncharacterized membrane protein
MSRSHHPAPTSIQQVFPVIEDQLEAVPGFSAASQQVANSIHTTVLNNAPLSRRVADALHGSWLGHPLHPALVHIPIGSWALSAFFDAIEVATGDHHAGQTADTLITIGAAAAVPTALAGIADYSAIKQDATAIAAAHGTLNSVGLGLYLLSRNARRRGNRKRGRLFSALALGCVAISASLGGDLVYRKRVGVNHSPEPEGPRQWADVISFSELMPGTAQRVEVDGIPVMLYRTEDDAIYAIGAVCSHAGGPLEEGTLRDCSVECPWHQSVFDLRDGTVIHGPATHNQPPFATRVHNGLIQIKLDD